MREQLAHKAFKMDVSELKRKSHVVISLKLADNKRIDFIELCGSEMAAAHLGHVGK